jgi:hypothetical protein
MPGEIAQEGRDPQERRAPRISLDPRQGTPNHDPSLAPERDTRHSCLGREAGALPRLHQVGWHVPEQTHAARGGGSRHPRQPRRPQQRATRDATRSQLFALRDYL